MLHVLKVSVDILIMKTCVRVLYVRVNREEVFN